MTKSYIDWIPISRKKPDPWSRVLVTYRTSYIGQDTTDRIDEDWVEDGIYPAVFYDDGIEQNMYLNDESDKPIKYYFMIEDGFDTVVGIRKDIRKSPRATMIYEITAWAYLPDPYHKTSKKKRIKNISKLLDELDEDDRNHPGKEDP